MSADWFLMCDFFLYFLCSMSILVFAFSSRLFWN